MNVFNLPAPLFIPTHWHDHFELIYMISGSAVIQVDGNYYYANPGDMIFVNSRQIHGSSQESSDARMVVVVFNELLLKNTCLDSTEIRYIIPTISREILIHNYFQ